MASRDVAGSIDRGEAPTAPFLLVTVGTDHHQFNRLMDWVEHWLSRRSEPVRCLVQHGSSRPVSGAEGLMMISPDDLHALMSKADAVICQGGPGSIMESRAAGRIPIVVARLRALGEVVDDHQVAFARRLAADDLIWLAESEAQFGALLDQTLVSPAKFRVVSTAADDAGDTMVRRFSELADALMLTGAGRGWRITGRLPRLWYRRDK